jgi:hypothetical protein
MTLASRPRDLVLGWHAAPFHWAKGKITPEE